MQARVWSPFSAPPWHAPCRSSRTCSSPLSPSKQVPRSCAVACHASEPGVATCQRRLHVEPPCCCTRPCCQDTPAVELAGGQQLEAGRAAACTCTEQEGIAASQADTLAAPVSPCSAAAWPTTSAAVRCCSTPCGAAASQRCTAAYTRRAAFGRGGRGCWGPAGCTAWRTGLGGLVCSLPPEPRFCSPASSPPLQLPLLVPDRGPLACAAQGPAGPSGFPLEGVPALDCRVFLTFVMLLGGLVAPTLLMARVQGPQCWAAAGTADEADEAGTAGGASQGPRRTADSGGSGADGSGSRGSSDADTGGDGSMRQGRSNKRCGARLCAAARAAISAAACCLRWAACEAGSILHHLCELLLGASGGVLAAAAWWMLVSLLWVTALLLEGASPGAADAT